MLRIRPLLSTFIISATLVLRCAFAQSTLTQIQDTVYTTGGAPFNGTVVVTWTGTTNPAGASLAPFNTAVKIYNGVLSVLLVPSTTATPAVPYRAVYSSSDGLISFSETWQVPPSATPLTLNQIRVTSTSGSGSTGTGSTGTTGPIPISQVTGLSSDLNAINGSLTSLTATLNGTAATVTTLTSTVATLTALVQGLAPGTVSTAFVDAEIPSGTIDGTNSSFVLGNAPSSPASLNVFLNGVMLANGADYTLSGTTITFLNNRVPQPGDVLQTYYRTSGVTSAPLFVDNETPQGTIDGTNVTFTLAAAPLPLLSLRLYKNGNLLQQNNDYTLSGLTVTFMSGTVAPQPGDSIVAFYRTTAPSVN